MHAHVARPSPPRWRPCFAFLLRWSTRYETAGTAGHIVKCARILRPVNWAPQPQPHLILVPGVMRARLARRETGAGGPAAQHPRLRWASALSPLRSAV